MDSAIAVRSDKDLRPLSEPVFERHRCDHENRSETTPERSVTSPPERPNPSRRRILRTAAILPALAIPALAVASPAHAAYNGEITRSNVMRRAENWYERRIQYKRVSTDKASDYEGGHQYRRDCSGFVSMCWHSPVGSNGGHATYELHEIAGQMPWDSLHEGDAVNAPHNHTILFDRWTDTPGTLWAYDLADPDVVDIGGMRHRTWSVSWLQANGYVPLRYHKITAG
jgi:hypothetical protein